MRRGVFLSLGNSRFRADQSETWHHHAMGFGFGQKRGRLWYLKYSITPWSTAKLVCKILIYHIEPAPFRFTQASAFCLRGA